ncbi:uncharacterized protein ACLA_094260 [Aspergillus clavatus NRRL 1]|uniref:Uncharacterized protein n=1 Tax=Aspergillus clavatus (strain ATCC 1007 / CBS 513.65 / DSM 816 / NCTC 3887 / NRRL 1 / QM 1276 / 107) TaxID=344612 RepID=A1CFS7_ASPCL|nr:uncharacterized protein ACLA_094260 [Aspergillus clavatus NRRL 1]EAW11726.1 conserved hypothetical protein [Aspergillus clavatus NRRL 1]
MALSKEAVILIVLVGCIVSVLIGYSVHFISTGGFRDDETEKEMTHEQKEYMRGLRLKHLEFLAAQVGRRYPMEA